MSLYSRIGRDIRELKKAIDELKNSRPTWTVRTTRVWVAQNGRRITRSVVRHLHHILYT